MAPKPSEDCTLALFTRATQSGVHSTLLLSSRVRTLKAVALIYLILRSADELLIRADRNREKPLLMRARAINSDHESVTP